jgi:hypothetical protein
VCVQRLAGLFLVGSNRMLLLTVQHNTTKHKGVCVMYCTLARWYVRLTFVCYFYGSLKSRFENYARIFENVAAHSHVRAPASRITCTSFYHLWR